MIGLVARFASLAAVPCSPSRTTYGLFPLLSLGQHDVPMPMELAGCPANRRGHPAVSLSAAYGSCSRDGGEPRQQS